ncbi:hypothetical protein Pmani_032103 [Petrolisthes manimaculis]|uniref:Uncharacterized protein n=1 Tax=Petrolisthes manimaculis TaxID=1843537 RepID=A0AAE1TU41_9EUCA|nr:hypothetical protein Pmani_032103 [Petrolisthes manimaculis]
MVGGWECACEEIHGNKCLGKWWRVLGGDGGGDECRMFLKWWRWVLHGCRGDIMEGGGWLVGGMIREDFYDIEGAELVGKVLESDDVKREKSNLWKGNETRRMNQQEKSLID